MKKLENNAVLGTNALKPLNDAKYLLVINVLQKSYGSIKAVDGLSLHLRKGEIYGLLGPNGAGKTTTIKSILGLLSLDGGDIEVLGFDPMISPEKVKAVIGYVSEEPSLYESMTVRELFNFITSIREINPERTTTIAREYLKSLDAIKYYNAFIGSLSRGNKQKIQIIAALLHEPRILILDEPLSGLDARSARVLKEIFQIHIDKGGCILLSTHIMEQAQTLCDRIGIIHQGKMVAEGTFDELQTIADTTGASLEDVFLQLTGQTESANSIIANLRKIYLQNI